MGFVVKLGGFEGGDEIGELGWREMRRKRVGVRSENGELGGERDGERERGENEGRQEWMREFGSDIKCGGKYDIYFIS